MTKGASGFTLLELLITASISALLLTLALPYARTLFELQRLKNCVEVIAGDLSYIRTESIKQNSPLAVSFTTNGALLWTYTATLFGTKSNATFPTIQMTSVTFAGVPATVTFNPVRGTANAGQIILSTSDSSNQLRINVGILGQISTCTLTANSIGGYPKC